MTRAQKHRYEVLASNLLLIGIVIASLTIYHQKKIFWDIHTQRTTKISVLAVIPLFIWLIYSIRKGRRWAKITYLVIAVVSIVSLVLDHKRVALMMSASMVTAITSIGQDLLEVVISILLVMSLRKPTPEPLLATNE